MAIPTTSLHAQLQALWSQLKPEANNEGNQLHYTTFEVKEEEESGSEANLENCVAMTCEKENRVDSNGEAGGKDDSVMVVQVECEVAAVDGEVGRPAEVEKPEQRRSEAFNESSRTKAGSRISRDDSQGIAIPKVGRGEVRGSINIKLVFSRILEDLNRPFLVIPRTCPFLLIKDTCTHEGSTTQMVLGPRLSLGRKGLIENRVFEPNLVSAGDNRELRPLIYYHNGPFSIFFGP
ncbi:hypothetical protein CsatB_023397 [Cannabis sativa]